MGTPTHSAVIMTLILGSCLINVAECSKVWGEVSVPDDLEVNREPKPLRYFGDDEDFVGDESSGDFISGEEEEEGSTPQPTEDYSQSTIYYRALVNFTDSLTYGPELDNINSDAFQDISAAVVDTLESDYLKIPGTQTVSVVLIKQIGRDVFVELDVGSDDNQNESEIRDVLYTVVNEGNIGSYTTAAAGFQFRRLGTVRPSPRPCTNDEFTCNDGACIPAEFLCDKRPDCPDYSDELNCETAMEAPPTPLPAPKTTPGSRFPAELGPCRVDQATCQNGECISRDYVCDGERDCSDGSDEFKCGTSTPCEPNEFRCKNGRCALKLWRCDGDNDCNDNSDETDCPIRKPGEPCSPEQFVCLSDQTCIPASFHCDDEPDCPDRSDEYACAPPTVTGHSEESITAARGQTVMLTCTAIGVPTPIITWRLNWGHVPTTSRITMTTESGRGTLIIRDVKEGDQGAYTCEAINAKGLVFAIPDSVLTLTRTPSNCPDGQFSMNGHCVPCFCFGITRNCLSSARYRNQISLRFNEEENFKGVNVSFPSRLGSPPPLSSTQLLINPEEEEFQLVDLSRRFLDLESYWTLPRQFLGSKVDSYGGYLRYKVSYSLQRDGSEPVEKPDVVLRGNGNRLIYRRRSPSSPFVKNQREIKFTEENWQHSSGRQVTREDLLTTLANLENISIRTIYNNRMASVGLSDVVMDTTSVEFSLQGHAKEVEECRCPPGYSGLSCELCSSGFERVPGGAYLGTCAGCNCHGHASACDPVSGHCLSCQHNTEGPQCEKCRPGYFGDPSRGQSDDCKPCPCPYTETSRRFSDTCFLNFDGQATCDACSLGYTGRRCERCAPGYAGNPLLPNGRCAPQTVSQCDDRGSVSSNSRPCSCKANVAGSSCDECKSGSFHLSGQNPDGCLQCFCMGVTKHCASSTWTRDQVRGGVNGQLFSLANKANTLTVTNGISQRGGTEVVYRAFSEISPDIYFWVLPQNFRGDKVTAYGGELRYTVQYEPRGRTTVIDNQPDVVLQGNGIFLEHFSQTKPLPRVSAHISVPFRESAWRRADGQPCTREHLLMALADVVVFMIRATYADSMAESSVADIQMDIAVPHSTGNERALEVEECACPAGYRGPSCQECDVGYTRTSSGLYLGTCERCECHGHASGCDPETGACLRCQHHTAGPRCESCLPGFYGNPVTGGIHSCRPCPCLGPNTGTTELRSCYPDTDGQPTCDNCPAGYTGRRCERCSPGYTGNPERGQSCTSGSGLCQHCDRSGSEGCDVNGACRCKMNTEDHTCSRCKPGTFHLSPVNKDGCLACFCMGVTQQCFSSPLYRDLISTEFVPGGDHGFALVNRQRTSRINTGFSIEVSTDGTQLSYTNFDQHSQEPHYWQLPASYRGDKITSYGGKLRYTITYVPGPRSAPIEDVDVQIIGNDITLVARQDWRRVQGSRESRNFEFVFREEFWQRPDGMPATREHLLMVLADLDDVLIRATYHTAMRSSTISEVSMEVAVPIYTGLARALEVEQCRCPPGYQGLSCQDCAQGYTRTSGGLYLGHCELCECNGHSDSCHPETGLCTSCLHNTMGEQCDQCSAGFFGDATAGTPEDCQPCACPHTDAENMFSPTCESLGNGDYQCTACQQGFTGQYCERCAPGYVGNPQRREKCRPSDAAANIVVRIYPERVHVSRGGSVSLRCQASGPSPHYFYWTREDNRPISSSAERRRQGEELHFSSVQSSDAGVYTCTCRSPLYTNRSRAEIIVTPSTSKSIEVFIEEPKTQHVRPGSTVSFICTARSEFPAYTLVWTRQGNRKLPERAMDFNGILTIQNVRPDDAGVYVCTGSNMIAMDEGEATLHIPAGEATRPTAAVQPTRLGVYRGQRAEFRCTATGNPTPTVEWTGGRGNRINGGAIIRGGVLIIPSVELADAGDYICRARSAHGEHTAQANLYLHRENDGEPVKPTVNIQPSTLTVQRGQRAEFRCTATGNPAPTTEWTRGSGSRIGGNVLIRDGVLIFPSVERADEGDYTCRALNIHGEHAARVALYTHRAPGEGTKPTATIHPPVLTIQQGRRAEFRCTATGNPPPTVEWTGGPGNRLGGNAVIRGEVLTFQSAERSDEGDYTCRALNVHGEHAARAVLYVHSASLPHVQVSPQQVEVKEGEDLRLYCRAGGNPSPGLNWKKRGGALPPQATPSHGFHQFKSNSLDALQRRIEEHQARAERTDYGTLHIPNVRLEDAGTYLCIGTNDAGSSEARIEVTVIKDADHISFDFNKNPNVLTGTEGGTLELNCNIPGNPPPLVVWSRADGLPLNANHQVEGTQLRILRASQKDSGEYFCRVPEGSGTVSIIVTITKAPSTSEVSIYPSVINVVVGEPLVLKCNTPGGKGPPPRVTWSRADGRALSSDSQFIGTQLRIPHASPEDSGEYICTVHSGAHIYKATAFVSINPETSQPDSFEVTIQPSNASVQEGETIELNCNVPGSPPPSVTWSRTDGRLLSSKHQRVGTQLRIPHASQEDAGEYMCRVQSGPNVYQATVFVSVNRVPETTTRLQGPIISIEPHSAVVRRGDSASFKCRVHSGAQPISLRWRFSNNQPLPGNVRISSDGSSLTISNAQPLNHGTFSCEASNSFGKTNSLVSLIIREPFVLSAIPRATVTPSGPVRVQVGDPVNLECQAAGEPRPTVSWHRRNSSRRPVPISPVPMESNAVMQILVARPEDSGIYVCSAQNTQGKTETQVEVIVEGGPLEPSVPRASVPEPLMIVEEGQTVTLHCDAQGFPKPSITWSKLRSPLPWRHKIVKGSLVLPTVGRQDSGQYICNATNPMGTSEVTVMLDVETPPYTTMMPDDIAVRVGEVIRLQCLSHGTLPLRFMWSKVEGAMSSRAEVHGGDLQINLAAPSDAGTYKCVASNKVGSSEAVAKVSVRSPLSVLVSPQVEIKALGSAVEFTCSASGGPYITLEWLKEGGALPHNHHIKDGVLRIENLVKSNEGIYICRATTVFGQAQDSAKLTLQALPKVMINVRTSVQTVMVGTSVEFECQAEGEPAPTVRWSKVGRPLPSHVQVKGGMLKIDRVAEADAGQYRCTATNDVGSVESQVVLNIQSLPQITAHPEIKEVTVGSNVVLTCIATGYPVPNITWSKMDKKLPSKCVPNGNALTIPNVTYEDSATYVCTASNKHGKVEALTELNVHEQVKLYFSQKPLSYIKLPTIKDSYKELRISITFRPDNMNGMILYNGQRRTMGADFISLGMVGGRPEFRFDVGTGMATIRYPTAIKLGEFHTVQLCRNGTKGSIIVDGKAPVNGTSQGNFQGLDLNEELFVGGYPNYSMIAKTAQIKTGFVGCISQLILQGEEVIFKNLDGNSTGVTNCTCKDQPCENGGTCLDSYKCNCRAGFTGSNCQHRSSQHCHPETCGPDATCVTHESGVGYLCRCHLGKSGNKCMEGTLVTTPMFNGNSSYIEYPPLTNIHYDLRIDVEFKAMNDDGLMFFSGGNETQWKDFVALSMVDGHVEFRYELGSGQAILRSPKRVSLDQWHRLTAERKNQDGTLRVDDGPEVRSSSPGTAQGLNIHTSMFLGGVTSMDILPKPANVSMLFMGCIGEVSINGKKVDLSYSVMESRDIKQCVDGNPCDRRPCRHGGSCFPSAEYEYQCLCVDGYEGERCEEVRNARCKRSAECQNGGSCVNGHCECPAGYKGVYCQEGQEAVGTEARWSSEGNGVNDSPALYAVYFHDDGYLNLPNPMFPRRAQFPLETIELEINTLSTDGLILWEGVAAGEQGKGKDFISLGIQNGHLVFSYQLGSGEVQIISRESISDGRWHRITAVRSGKDGYMQVDGQAAQHGQSQGTSIKADTKGSIYLGGAPNLKALTDGRFSSGITGCIRNVSLLNARPGEKTSRPIDLQQHAQSGVNVQRCTS